MPFTGYEKKPSMKSPSGTVSQQRNGTSTFRSGFYPTKRVIRTSVDLPSSGQDGFQDKHGSQKITGAHKA